MPKLLDIVEGWSAELGPFTLLLGNGQAADLSGKTVELCLRDKTRTIVEAAAEVRIDDDPVSGRVYVTPGSSDFANARSPYWVHFKVMDGSGRSEFFPHAAADFINVFKA